MPDTDFNIPDFLRLIGRGPDERPEWWEWANTQQQYLKEYERRIRKPDPLWNCIAPFADILTDWTPEKDALLLGAGLEYCRSVAGPSPALATPEAKLVWQKLTDNGHSWYTLVFHCDSPGLTLARAIWDAMKVTEQ